MPWLLDLCKIITVFTDHSSQPWSHFFCSSGDVPPTKRFRAWIPSIRSQSILSLFHRHPRQTLQAKSTHDRIQLMLFQQLWFFFVLASLLQCRCHILFRALSALNQTRTRSQLIFLLSKSFQTAVVFTCRVFQLVLPLFSLSQILNAPSQPHATVRSKTRVTMFTKNDSGWARRRWRLVFRIIFIAITRATITRRWTESRLSSENIEALMNACQWLRRL